MPQSWVCRGGHCGTGPHSPSACPVCGAPVDPVPDEDPAAPAQDDTMVGASKPPADRADAAVRLEGVSPFSPLIPAAPPVVLDQTMDRPSKSLSSLGTPSRFDPPPAPSWPSSILPLSEPSQDDTLDKPTQAGSDAGPPPTNGMPTTALAASPPHGETLVKPSAAPTASPHAGGAATPSILSGYEYLGVLGRGGMGVVYKAKQLGLNRIVALKMILAGSHASAEDLTRFKIEAEAVAHLKHPNIVQIYDTGERDGKPYFSLEYLEGGSLQHRLKGDPLQPRAAAALLETIARAMDYAHKHGIVHRDLKPANILLAEPPPTPLERCTPKVTDFGLAKRLESADQGQTGTEAVLGTPTYMAPEQASNSKAVGPAADIYALGAILYDLLTGRPPFKGTTVLDTLQMVQKAEPVAPVALNNRVPRDLQTICLKCLEKEPGKRYASAADLADDLRRYIDGEAIRARPVGRVERTWKWAKRHPTSAALLALSVAAPLVIAAVSLAAAVQLSSAYADVSKAKSALEVSNEELKDREKRLEEALAAKEAERKKAEDARVAAFKAEARAVREEKDAQDSFLRAQKAVDEMITLVQKRLRNEAGTETVRRALLEEAVKMCRHFTEKPGANPASRLRAARAHRLSGDLRSRLGDAGAEEDYLASLKLYDGLIGQAEKRDRITYETEAFEAALHHWSARAGRRSDGAEELLGQVLQRLERMPADLAAEPIHRRNRAVLLANRAILHQNNRRFEDAEADYAAAAGELRKLKATPASALELGRLEVNRSALYLTASQARAERSAENLEKAADAGGRAVSILGKIVEEDPAEGEAALELGRAATNLGLVHVARKDLSASAKVYDHAVTVFDRLHRKFPLYVDYKHLLAVALNNQGMQYLQEGLAPRAREPLARGRKLLEELVEGFADVPAYRHDLARVCASQGVQYLSVDQPAQALEPLQTAQKYLEEAVKASPRNDALKGDLKVVVENMTNCHHHLAKAAADRKEWAKAEGHVKAMVEVRERRVKDLPLLPASAPLAARLDRAAEALAARAELYGTLLAWGKVAEKRGDHRTAAKTVERLKEYLPPSWPGWTEPAALLCRCAKMAEEDKALDARTRARLAEQYGLEALRLLEGAAGQVPDLQRLLREGDFEVLRKKLGASEEYRRLLAKARKKT